MVRYTLALAISYQRHTAETQIQSQARPYGICGGQSSAEIGFL